MPKVAAVLLALALSLPAAAAPRDINAYVSAGVSMQNWHGQAKIGTLQLEMATQPKRVERWLKNTDVGTSLVLSEINQPRSFYGEQPDGRGNVQALGLGLFARHYWRTSSPTAIPFLEIGSGPMFSRADVPAYTSNINFSSQLAVGAVFFPQSHTPLRLGWRFYHISNGVIGDRNPGLNVNSFFVGTHIATFGR